MMTASITRRRVRRWVNSLMLGLTAVSTLIVVAPLIWIIAYVIQQGLPGLTPGFFTSLPTPVGIPGGGISNALVGSLLTVGGATLISAPVGMLAGLYAAAHADSGLGMAIRFGTDLIAGVPSIVIGIFAYTLIVLPQRHFSAFAGAVALSFIMLPTIIRTTEEMIRLVPRSLREGALALGAPEWKTTMRVMLPAAIEGLLTGLMLAIARGAGEAAPMLFTAFGNPFMNLRMDQPTATLPHLIFVYAISPYEDWHAKAWATALVLIAVVLVLNVAGRLVVWWRARWLGAVR